jgi:pimeloyl-ACP methyl ester carboxylesterase
VRGHGGHAFGRRSCRVPVVFINAAGMSTSLLADLPAAFEADGLRCLSWSLRPTTDPSPEAAAVLHEGDLHEVLAEHDVGRFHLVAWCTGASIALRLWDRIRDRIDSLTMIDGSFLFRGTPGGQLGNAMFQMCRELREDLKQADRYYEAVRPRGNEGRYLGVEDDRLLAELLRPRMEARRGCSTTPCRFSRRATTIRACSWADWTHRRCSWPGGMTAWCPTRAASRARSWQRTRRSCGRHRRPLRSLYGRASAQAGRGLYSVGR